MSEKQQQVVELEHSVSEQRERTRKMMKQMVKKITHRMESTGMFCKFFLSELVDHGPKRSGGSP